MSNARRIRGSRGRDVPMERRRRVAQAMRDLGHADVGVFLLHLLPRGFHGIRYYGLLATSASRANLARARELLAVAPPPDDDATEEPLDARPPCPSCGGHMIIIETFARWSQPTAPAHVPSPTGRLLLRDPARTARTEPHSRRSNRAFANGPTRVRCRQLRFQGVLRPAVQQRKPTRLAPAPQRSGSPDMPERPPNHSQHHPKIKFPMDQCLLPRGFVLRRLSYASRRPKLFANPDQPHWSAQRQRSHVRSWRLPTGACRPHRLSP